MPLSDKDIEQAIVYRLFVAARKGETLRAASDGEFVKKFRLSVSKTRIARVLGRAVRDRRVCRSRQWQTHPDSSDRPVTFWLPSDSTPSCVLAYRR